MTDQNETVIIITVDSKYFTVRTLQGVATDTEFNEVLRAYYILKVVYI